MIWRVAGGVASSVVVVAVATVAWGVKSGAIGYVPWLPLAIAAVPMLVVVVLAGRRGVQIGLVVGAVLGAGVSVLLVRRAHDRALVDARALCVTAIQELGGKVYGCPEKSIPCLRLPDDERLACVKEAVRLLAPASPSPRTP